MTVQSTTCVLAAVSEHKRQKYCKVRN